MQLDLGRVLLWIGRRRNRPITYDDLLRAEKRALAGEEALAEIGLIEDIILVCRCGHWEPWDPSVESAPGFVKRTDELGEEVVEEVSCPDCGGEHRTLAVGIEPLEAAIKRVLPERVIQELNDRRDEGRCVFCERPRGQLHETDCPLSGVTSRSPQGKRPQIVGKEVKDG